MISPEQNAFQNALSDFTFEAACGGAIRHLADSGCTAKQIMERLDYPISGERVRKALYKYLCDTSVILEKSPEEELPEAKPEYIMEYNSYGKPSYRRKNTESTRGNLSGFDSAGTAWKEIVYRPVCGLAGQTSEVVTGKMPGCSGQGILKRVRRNFGREVPESTCRSYDGKRGNKIFGCSDQGDYGKPAVYSGRGAELAAFLTEKCSQKKEETVYISCDFGISDSASAKGVPLLNGRQQEYLEGIPWPRHRVYHRLDHRMTEILCSLYEQRSYEGICYFLSRREKLKITGS